MSSVEHSANPSTLCASGRSGLRQAHISRCTWKRCGLGMPAPSEEGFRAVSSDASCRFAVSGRCSDCTTRQSVVYRAPPPKYGDTGSALNRSIQSIKTNLRTIIISKKAAGKKTWCPRAQANEDFPPPRSGAVNTLFYGVSLPSVSSVDHSANPAASCAWGRSGLQRVHISRSTRKRIGLVKQRPMYWPCDIRAVSSDASCRFVCFRTSF